MGEEPRRLGVLGSPIAHSRSPVLHRAAYRVLGLPWSYEAIEVDSGELAPKIASLDGTWRGLSLTMPLKREVLGLLDARDPLVDTVGAANTVLLDGGSLTGFNTDVYGAETMLAEALDRRLDSAIVLGSGATARSVIVALARRGVAAVTLWSRTPGRTGEFEELADACGVTLRRVATPPDHGASHARANQIGTADVVVSTLPGGVRLESAFPAALRCAVPLVDIAYDPWPSAIARHWREVGGEIVSNGLGMLVHQALQQVRIFVSGSVDAQLPEEGAVLAALREAAIDPS